MTTELTRHDYVIPTAPAAEATADAGASDLSSPAQHA
jgi:hypothetical protein